MKFLISIGTTLLLGFLGGCSKQLEEQTFSTINPDLVYRTRTDVDAAVVSAFSIFSASNTAMMDFLNTDCESEYLAMNTSPGNLYDLHSYTDANVPPLSGLWTESYRAINRANAIIGRVPTQGTEVSEEQKSIYIAEAKWLRAWCNFNLVRLFGAVPLRLQETLSPNEYFKAKSSPSEIYASIVADLDEAIANLPNIRTGSSEKGRPNKGTAKFLLGKVYLTIAGQPVNDPSHLADARDLLLDVYTNKATYGFTLFPNYRQNFSLDANLVYQTSLKVTAAPSTEIILGFQHSTSSSPAFPSMMSYSTLPGGSAEASGAGNGFGLCGLTPEFYSLFEEEDQRRDVTIISEWTVLATGKVNVYGSTGYGLPGTVTGGYVVGKYRAQNGRVGTGAFVFDNDEVIYRFSDVLMMLAEIYNELDGGPDVNALTYMNQVRARAGASQLVAGTYTQQTFRDFLYFERYREFMYEGSVVFDLRRWGRLQQAMSADPVTQKANVTYSPEFDLFPIPSSETLNNPLL